MHVGAEFMARNARDALDVEHADGGDPIPLGKRLRRDAELVGKGGRVPGRGLRAVKGLARDG